VEVVLVRHASTSWSGQRYCGRGDPPLNATGRREAADLAGRLGRTLPRGIRIVSSPSKRAVATARAIRGAIEEAPAIELDPRWLETDFGVAEGRRFDDLAAEQPDLAASILGGSVSIDWPGGETSSALAMRVQAAWDDLLADGRDAVVVTHAGPLLHAIAIGSGVRAVLASIPSPAGAVRLTVPARRARDRAVLGSRP
jgi:alpha-ribazole phosphatase